MVKNRYSDTELGRAIRLLINGSSLSEISRELNRKEENVEKKLGEIRDAISSVVNQSFFGGDLFDIQQSFDDELDIEDPLGDDLKDEVTSIYEDSNKLTIVTSHLDSKKMAYAIDHKGEFVHIFKDQNKTEIGDSAYHYYYKTKQWTAPNMPGVVYRAKSIEFFVQENYSSAKDDAIFKAEREAQRKLESETKMKIITSEEKRFLNRILGR